MWYLVKKNIDIKPPGICVFCEQKGLTKEHIWPVWSSQYLKPTTNSYIEDLTLRTGLSSTVNSKSVKEKPGTTFTKKIRVVCRKCNNGWMSDLETDTKPILSKLIATQNHVLEKQEIEQLIKWITLKVLVLEHSQRKDAVTPFFERKAFKESFRMPSNFRIWIAKCGVSGWEGTFWRDASTVSTNEELPATGIDKNIHSITFGFGDLLVHVIHTSLKDLKIDLDVSVPDCIYSLYPYSSPISWPPSKSLSSDEAHRLTKSLPTYLKSRIKGWKSVSK
jgi:hypothetical protein